MHHVQLSVMADLKANGLMTIAAVMLTFSAPFLAREPFKPAVIMLMIFCLATIVLAIFTVVPAAPLRPGAVNPKDAAERGFNLLFFGCFTALSYEQFESEMERVMNDPSETYQAQVCEIYTLGVFLAKKKYRFLRYAYLTFATGLFVSAAILACGLL